ncbi:hypothetical protein P3339_18855 [Microbulbifer sp. MLAF003]|uniref:hypothetical protein n=1 Tax=unclassified Microbulbifer TaxID=2619833 RepID=UPI0024ADFE6B|nr:hypothetical protein [Microbulbifer sp. MLAF003]WHI50477.1 hypothetical protein P3339_18855 [Microbulbifer sp. MLAF003]
MKNLFFLTLLISLSENVYSTVQVQEELWIDGATFYIEELPLQQHPDFKEINGYFDRTVCSGNWRGYKGYWVIRDKELWLNQLEKNNPCGKTSEYLDLSSVFNEKSALRGIPASWVTGDLSFRISSISNTPNYEYYEYEAVIYTLENGQLTNREIKTIRVDRRKH